MHRSSVIRSTGFVVLLVATTVSALYSTALASLTATEATPTTVTISWTAVGDDGLVGTASQYDIRFSTATITDANWASATQVTGEPLPQIAGTTEEFTVTGLVPSTSYYFAIKVADDVPNWSTLSNVVLKTTAVEATPPVAISNLATGSATSSSLTLTWSAPGDDGNVGTASQYDIRYSTSTITVGNWASAIQVTGEPAPQVAGTSQSFVVSGLSPITTCYFAILTADEVPNWSSLSNIAGGTTTNETTPPAVIANLAASSPTANSITLTWTAPGDDGSVGTASQYDIRYSTATITAANFAGATQVSGEPTPKVAGSSESFVVSGLTYNTRYYFAIRTGDEVPNWSAISNVANALTLNEATPPAAIANISVSASSSTALTLSWTAPGDDGSVGTASQYDLRYSTSTITDANWSSATQVSGEPTPKVAGSAESFQVTGLTPLVTYYFAIKTADEVPNWSALSNVAYGTTSNETTPPATIANLGAGSSTEHSITLGWTAPGDDGNSGTASQYDIRYATVTITTANWDACTQATGEPSPKVGGSVESFVVTGLNSNTTFYFAIKTADEVPNWSGLSNVASSTTSPDATAPSAVSNMTAIQPTTTSLTLAWTAPGDDGVSGTAYQYDIRYSTATITDANWGSALQVTGEPSPSVAGTLQTCTVTGLAEGTKYYCALKTSDEVPNWSTLSNVASGTTSPDVTPPASINDLTAVTGTEDGEIELAWTAPGDDSLAGQAMAYFIRYAQQPISEGNWESGLVFTAPPTPQPAGTPETATLTGLVPGQLYYVAIKTYDDGLNPSGLSNVPSAISELSIILANDDLAEPSSPPSDAVLSTSQPVLTVENANIAADNIYRFELATDSNFVALVAGSPVDQQPGSNTTSWKIPVKLDPDQEYYWRVATNDAGYSSVYSFAVEPFAHAYPNPMHLSEGDAATFTDLPEGSQLVLMSVSGSVVKRWANIDGQDISWDGTNESGSTVSSGTYLWYLSDSGASGKLLVVR
jgi:hypothetical protein